MAFDRNAYNKEWLRKKKERDPKYAEKRRAYLREYQQRWKARQALENPDKVEAQRKRANARRQEKLENPSEREKRKARAREWHNKRYAEDTEYREKRRGEVRGRYWRRKQADPDALRRDQRDKLLKHRFGKSLEWYEEMLAAQGGVCAICRGPETTQVNGRTMDLSVDHCHSSERVRALLCNRCNRLLGFAADSEELLLAAVAYLREHAQVNLSRMPFGAP